MKTKQTTFYICEKCEANYTTAKDAQICEAQPITQDKGAKVGSIVKITSGDGTGSLAKVTKRMVYDNHWGHHTAARYWHTVGLQAEIIGLWGYRQLTFDDYEMV